MVIGIAMMAAMVPTVYGLGEASQNNKRERNKGDLEEKYHLITACNLSSVPRHQKAQIDNAKVYLGIDGRIYVSRHQPSQMIPFTGCLHSHPDFSQGNLAGLVTISPETPPQVRWAFLDSNTHEMRWGGREDREGHISGPFGLVDDEGSLMLNGSRMWIAVRPASHEEGEVDFDPTAVVEPWRLYFDLGQDQYTGLPPGMEKIEIELKMIRYPERGSQLI